jgi:hypothetical protein
VLGKVRRSQSFPIDNPPSGFDSERGFRSFQPKFSEFRNNSAFDEAVYIGESVMGDTDIGIPFAKLYREHRIWFEIQLVLVPKRDTYLNYIFAVKVLNQHGRIIRNKNRDSSAVDRDDAMLVDIAERVQLQRG